MRVNRYDYWTERPPIPSPNLAKWVAKIKAGWWPNSRIGCMGYDEKCHFFGIYLWEYFNVILPLMEQQIEQPEDFIEIDGKTIPCFE